MEALGGLGAQGRSRPSESTRAAAGERRRNRARCRRMRAPPLILLSAGEVVDAGEPPGQLAMAREGLGARQRRLGGDGSARPEIREIERRRGKEREEWAGEARGADGGSSLSPHPTLFAIVAANGRWRAPRPRERRHADGVGRMSREWAGWVLPRCQVSLCLFSVFSFFN
jgi:hypothetical protein